MSGAAKAVKKIVKPITKIAKKVVKGVVKLGKKVVKGVGKATGKLGPIGTIAMMYVAPWAISSMAGSSIGWVSSLGKGLQAVGSAVQAPFKALGQVAGGVVDKVGSSLAQSVGGSLGQGIQTITTKMTDFLGYQGNGISEGVQNVFDGVKADWNNAFGTEFTASSGQVAQTAAQQASTSALEAGLTPGGEQAKMLMEQTAGMDGFMSQGIDRGAIEALKDSKGYNLSRHLAEQNVGFGQAGVRASVGEDPFTVDGAGAAGAQPSLLDKAKKAFTGMGSLAGAGKGTASSIVQPINPGSYSLESATPGPGVGAGGSGGTSFYAQNLTGLLPTEEYVQRQQSLLGRV